MIDIVGNIKIDETKPERIKYLLACIRSYAFMAGESRFHLNLENASVYLHTLVAKELKRCGFHYMLTTGRFKNYGDCYSHLLTCMSVPGVYGYIINFMEDQFMLIDNLDDVNTLLHRMDAHQVDVCMCGFNKVEKASATGLDTYMVTPVGFIYENTMENYTAFSRFYGSRYYIGVNFITTYHFAKRFWDRDCGPRPHEYEISFYDKDWLHTVLIPEKEIQVAIDDDHGAEGSCLLKRQEIKWQKIIAEINQDYFDEINPFKTENSKSIVL